MFPGKIQVFTMTERVVMVYIWRAAIARSAEAKDRETRKYGNVY